MDAILSVRISDELKEKFQSLAEEEGINNKEFMDLIIRNYEVNKAATNTDFVKSDIDELQNIIKRILDIYINVIEKNKLKNSEIANTFKGTLEEEANKNEKLKEDISNLKKEIDEIRTENNNLKDSLKEHKALLEKEREDLKGYKELNLMLKEKINELNSYKNEAVDLKKRNEEIASHFKTTKEEKDSYISKLNEELRRNDILKSQIDDIKINYEDKIIEMTRDFERQMKLKDDEIEITIQKEVLQKEEEYRKEIWSVKSVYNDKISKLIEDKEELILKFRENIVNK